MTDSRKFHDGRHDGLVALESLDLGFHGEKSIAQFTKNGTDLDRGAVWARYTIDESPSLYSPRNFQ